MTRNASVLSGFLGATRCEGGRIVKPFERKFHIYLEKFCNHQDDGPKLKYFDIKECPKCKGSGIALTEDGQVLIDFLERYKKES